jgi:hypothetical protein
MVRESEGAWRKRLARWKKFDGTVAAFCTNEGVSDKTFYQWRKRLGRVSSTSGDVAFVELSAPRSQSAVEVVVGEEVRVRVHDDFDAATLNRVLDVLEARR